MLDWIESQRKGLIQKGILKEEETLKACRIYVSPTGDLLLFARDEVVPAGYKESLNNVIPEHEFWKWVSLGKFPIGTL